MPDRHTRVFVKKESGILMIGNEGMSTDCLADYRTASFFLVSKHDFGYLLRRSDTNYEGTHIHTESLSR